MATLLFAAAGSAIGASIGGSFLGISAAAAGQAIGGFLGRQVDQALFGPTQRVEGPRLDSLEVQVSQEGAPLGVVEGHGRVAGSVIWATRLLERKKTTRHGGKGSGPKAESTEYTYFANFAVALMDCTTGPVRHFGRVWADGKLVDLSKHKVRFYHGTETQEPDPFIVAKEGSAPAYRGTAYVVFEDFPVTDYGRRIPNFTFEIWGQSGEMESLVQGVDVIPASTEFGYSPSVITKGEQGKDGRENAIRYQKTSDWTLAMDQLQSALPNCGTVALVVSWFGTDLRAGECRVEPRVERRDKATSRAWTVAGRDRATANLVSYVDGRPAFGSTPDDQSVMDAIKDLKTRGLRVVLYPFVMMDIPAENTLPDPDTGDAGQPVYPWRGRIRLDTNGAAASAQVAAFTGTAAPADFPAGSGVPTYTGPNEWTFRRFILHLAALARNAGGVDAFLVGSEMVGMTSMQDGAGVFPFVDALVDLAADVKTMIPAAQVSYAADWSEYHSHRDGGEVFFHLDPLWSSPDVDFIGIDNYLPLSDWRQGKAHLDYDPDNGAASPYSLDYLKSQIEGGEYWDYYYASESDRDSQVRTPIWDGAHGEDWVFRQKAIRDWWSNAHHNRPGGVRDASATAWVPSSKPVWFTEFGCPAVDLGANQPNVFYDPKSSESFFPYYSNGNRDDFIQRQYLRAMCEWWRDNGGACVSVSDMLAWSWDTRPWPEFPRNGEQWADGPNWRRGHWLNGRAGAAPAAEALARRLQVHYGYAPEDFDVSECYGQADGQILEGPASFREFLANWEALLRLDAAEDGGVLRIASRAAARQVVELTPEDLVEDGQSAPYRITRSSLEETPRAAVIRYSDSDRDYQSAAARAAIRNDPGEAETRADLSIVSDLGRMTVAAEVMLRSAADKRESVELTLPPSTPVRPGHVFRFTPRDGRPMRFVAEEIVRGAARRVRGTLYSDAVFGPALGPERPSLAVIAPPAETALAVLLDLPLLPGVEVEDHQGFAAFLSNPWPGGADLYRSPDSETGFELVLRSGLPGSVGETLSDLPAGVTDRWSQEVLEVRLDYGALVSRPESDVLSGGNALALEHAPGQWEVLQFLSAELIGVDTWRLSGLLRGQLGTEWVRDPGGLPSGARLVLLDAGIAPVEMVPADIGRPFYWRSVTIGTDPADAPDTVSHTFTGAARRPLSPVHLEAEVSGGSLTLSWVRRTRVEGDEWPDSGDVPLGEAFERYLVEVGPEGAPVIRAEVDTPSAVLDVSGLSGAQEVRVSQVSETYGPGVPARLDMTF